MRGYNKSIAEKTFEQLMRKQKNLWGYFLTSADDNTVVGYALITSYWCNEEGGNIIIVDELYIDNKYRHKGYGKLFLEWIERHFKDKAVSITLEVTGTNVSAKRLYAGLGYANDGFEVMEKRL